MYTKQVGPFVKVNGKVVNTQSNPAHLVRLIYLSYSEISLRLTGICKQAIYK